MQTTIPLTLDAVKHQFTMWRSNKTSGKRIPDTLWAMVQQLLGQYKYSVIAATLGISCAQFKKKFPSLFQVNAPDIKQQDFIHLPVAPLLNSTISQLQPSLTLERANGAKLSLFNLTLEQITLLVNQFAE